MSKDILDRCDSGVADAWLVTDTLKGRTKFVLKCQERFNEAEGGRVNVAELCRMFGISR